MHVYPASVTRTAVGFPLEALETEAMTRPDEEEVPLEQ